jgi:hypothetical protein
MALQSYSDLVTEIGTWLNRGDLGTEIPTFIRLFEARMNRRLRTPDQEVTADVTLLTGVNQYAIPGAIRQVKLIYTTDANGVFVTLTPMPLLKLQADYPSQEQGIPMAYAIDATNIWIAPSPDGISNAATMTVAGYRTLPALDGVTATSNWLLSSHPDAYLYGCLLEAAVYLRDDEHIDLWRAASDDVLEDVFREATERQIPMGPLKTLPAVWE